MFLETERLVLRDKESADLDFLASLYADERVMRFIGDGATVRREEVEARLRRVLQVESAPDHERWDAFKIVERKADGAPLGQAGMLRCEIDDRPEVEIGWWLAPDAWGRGYATEAALALRDYAFDVLGLERLCVVLFAGNVRSVAVAERIGGTDAAPAVYRGRTVRRYVVLPGARRSPSQPSDGSVSQKSRMLQKDLTTSYPRSVRDEVLGVVQLGRAIDKGIAFANGKNGEYNFDCPMDRALFGFLGMDGNALLEVIRKAQSQAEIEAYVKPFVDKKSADEIAHFNETFLAAGPQPGTDSYGYFVELRNQVAPDRTDVTSWPDLLDLDEKRPVPVRTAA